MVGIPTPSDPTGHGSIPLPPQGTNNDNVTESHNQQRPHQKLQQQVPTVKRVTSPPLHIDLQRRMLASTSKTCSPLSIGSTSDTNKQHDLRLNNDGAARVRHESKKGDESSSPSRSLSPKLLDTSTEFAGLQTELTMAEDDDESMVVPSDLLDRLRTFSLFRNAPPLFHRQIARRLKLIQFHPQEYIVKAGEPAKSMYWILRGTVGVTSTDGESIYAELVAGTFFGEIGILFNRPRTATVVSRTRVLLGVLTKDVLHQVLPDYPVIERLIRDEAQERLAMQEKKKKAGLVALPSRRSSYSGTPLPLGINASQILELNSNIPGPVLPPCMSPVLDALLEDAPRTTSPFTDNSQYVDDVDESIAAREFLKNLPLFQTLPSQLIHELALSVVLQKYNVFDLVFKKGDLGTDIFFIVAGKVEIIDPSRSNTVLAQLGPGKYFGEMAFLSLLSNENDGDKRTADVRVIQDTVLMIVTGAKLQNICQRYPLICEDMKQTAGERCKHNGSIDATDDCHNEDHSKVIQPAFRRVSTYSIINHDDDNQQQSAEQDPKEEKVIWKPNFYNHSNDSNVSPNPKSPSPLSDVFSRANSMISSTTVNTTQSGKVSKSSAAVTHNNFRRHHDISPNSEPMSLAVPPLNPLVPSLNSLSFKHQGQFQYMPLLKRMRLNNNNSFSRRRSSLLSTGPLNDRIFLQVFSYLDLKELMKLRRVCRRWRQLLLISETLFKTLDLRPWNTFITDSVLKNIIDFVGSRPNVIDISDCFHITDEGFSYLVNEIGIKGSIKVLKMRSVWKVSAMAIMDLSLPSVGHHLESIELVNCRNVRDDVMERLIGGGIADGMHSKFEDFYYYHQQLDHPRHFQYGCFNLKHLDLSYCKHLTDKTMHVLLEVASDRLETLILTRCTTITDNGFRAWSLKQFPRLRKLVLRDCTYLTDNSMICILTLAPDLKYLDSSFCCALSDSSIDFLCFCCKQLEFLNLSFCGSAVSDISLVSISRLNNLQKLIIVGCLRVTREGVDRLLAGSRSLRLIDLGQCKNAHDYPYGGGPGEKWVPRPRSRSLFIKVEPFDRVIEIIL